MLPELFVHNSVTSVLGALPPRPWEVGGWLIGYRTTDGAAIVVTHRTPAVGRGTAFGVTISGQGHRKLFDAIFDDSVGIVTFLGDWHSHPGGPATPSGQDRRAMAQLAEDPDYGIPVPLIGIVSTGRLRQRASETRWWLRAAGGQVAELLAQPFGGPVPGPAGDIDARARARLSNLHLR